MRKDREVMDLLVEAVITMGVFLMLALHSVS